MAAEGGVIITYVFTGEERDEEGRFVIPQNVTHLLFHESITVIPAELFYEHQNIIEVYCHIGVKKIEQYAFHNCPRLKRVIIPGVEVVEYRAFTWCAVLDYVECPKLESIEGGAFEDCRALGSIDLPSAKVVWEYAFSTCEALTDVKFGRHLVTIFRKVFDDCRSLERITIPLKNDLLATNGAFQRCYNLERVGLVEEAALRDTVDALHFEERNDMKGAIDSINHFLPEIRSDERDDEDDEGNTSVKTVVIRLWIGRVLRKIIDYKAQHRSLLNEATATLKLVLPNDIVMSNVLLF